MKSTWSLFILLLFSCASIAQQVAFTEKDYVLRYKKAVQLYADQKYFEAKDELSILTSRKYDNSMTPYAIYYHALCSFKLKKYFDARTMLRQIFERFPDWKRIEEANYLYATASFAGNYIDEGMQYINRITTNDLKQDLENMQYFYFSKIRDIVQLKQLNQKYPNNAVIAQLVVDNIQKNKVASREDLELSDQLTNRFKLGESTTAPPKKVNSRPRENNGVITVAVLEPFRLSVFYASNCTCPNQYV